MACDRAFGNIEKALRAHGDIYSKMDYCNIIKSAVYATYQVIELTRDDILDVDELKKYVVQRKPRQPYKFQDARKFVFQLHFREGYILCMDYRDDAPLGTVRLMPGKGAHRTSEFNLSRVALLPKFDRPLQLKPDKIVDLKILATFIKPPHCEYLHQHFRDQEELEQQQQQSRATAQLHEQEEDDSDSDLLDYDDAWLPRPRKCYS